MTLSEWKVLLSQHAVNVVPLPDLVGVLVKIRGEETLVLTEAGNFVLVAVDVPLVGQGKAGGKP